VKQSARRDPSSGAKKCPRYSAQGDARVKCKAPAEAGLGAAKVEVTTTAGASSARGFRVKHRRDLPGAGAAAWPPAGVAGAGHARAGERLVNTGVPAVIE